MCSLYSGIYRVALNLQRKSEAKRSKMTSLVMAGGEVSKIGAGMVHHHGCDEGDDEAALRTARPRHTATGSKRPKQLNTTSTTVLLSPKYIMNQVHDRRQTQFNRYRN